MQNKRYSSYAEIDRDLEILKIEKELSYQKIIKNFDDTKQSLTPGKLLGKMGIPDVAIDAVSSFAGPLKGMLISMFLKKLIK